VGAGNVYSSQARALPFQYLPHIDVSFDDVDARDIYNQPIKTLSAKDELKGLFQTAVFTRLVCSEIYSIAQALSILEKKLNLAAHSLVETALPIVGEVVVTLLPLKRNWDSAIVQISGLFAFNILIILFFLSLSFSTPTAVPAAFVVLRC
jgi:hypothetical protein